MADMINPVLQPAIELVQPILMKLSVLVGGIFGLYLILIFVRIHYERKKVKLLQDIKYNLDQSNKKHNVPYSKIRKRWWKKLLEKLES